MKKLFLLVLMLVLTISCLDNKKKEEMEQLRQRNIELEKQLEAEKQKKLEEERKIEEEKRKAEEEKKKLENIKFTKEVLYSQYDKIKVYGETKTNKTKITIVKSNIDWLDKLIVKAFLEGNYSSINAKVNQTKKEHLELNETIRNGEMNYASEAFDIEELNYKGRKGALLFFEHIVEYGGPANFGVSHYVAIDTNKKKRIKIDDIINPEFEKQFSRKIIEIAKRDHGMYFKTSEKEYASFYFNNKGLVYIIEEGAGYNPEIIVPWKEINPLLREEYRQ